MLFCRSFFSRGQIIGQIIVEIKFSIAFKILKRIRGDGCPDKWREHNDHCYLLGNLLGEETKPRTWHQGSELKPEVILSDRKYRHSTGSRNI